MMETKTWRADIGSSSSGMWPSSDSVIVCVRRKKCLNIGIAGGEPAMADKDPIFHFSADYFHAKKEWF